MAITAQDVNKLRQMTGAGMMDCKKALTEANGDMEAAVDILRKQGQKIASKEGTLKISNLVSGFYYLNIRSGNKSETYRFSKGNSRASARGRCSIQT